MYQPNFCSECGSRIERTRWHLWTSRQFCSDCAQRFRRAQLMTPIIAAVALFAVGLATGRAVRRAPPPLIVERGQLATISVPSTPSTGQTGATESGREPASVSL